MGFPRRPICYYCPLACSYLPYSGGPLAYKYMLWCVCMGYVPLTTLRPGYQVNQCLRYWQQPSSSGGNLGCFWDESLGGSFPPHLLNPLPGETVLLSGIRAKGSTVGWGGHTWVGGRAVTWAWLPGACKALSRELSSPDSLSLGDTTPACQPGADLTGGIYKWHKLSPWGLTWALHLQ